MKISLGWLCVIVSSVTNCAKISLDTPVSGIKDLQTLENVLRRGYDKIPAHCVAMASGKVRFRTSCDIWLAERNCVELLEALASGNPGYYIDEDVLLHAALTGSLESLKWARSRRASFATADILIGTAVEAGHEAVAHWLFVTFSVVPTIYSIEVAALRGHLGVLTWVFETFQIQFLPESVLDSGIEGSQWHIAAWLIETAKVKPSRVSQICILSKQGNLKQLQSEYQSENQREEFLYQKAANCAASSGQLSILEWLQRVAGTLPNNVHSICKNGHLNVLVWLYDKNNSPLADLTSLAASHGHIDIIAWLHSTFNVLPDTYALALAAEGRHLTAIEWALSRDLTLSSSPVIADAAARHGHANLLEWTHDHSHGPSKDGLLDAAYGAHLSVLVSIHSRTSVCSQELVNQAAMSSRRIDKFAVLDWLYAVCKLLPTQHNDLEVGRWADEVSNTFKTSEMSKMSEMPKIETASLQEPTKSEL
ncbi:hypothetical protein PSACC_03043 [Paramicrosporidium saccamoebae]|uniref:Uncharacterized protein n=1 Tax=Paramicrosporidium saccamoebae TaxID=1246581 RepID=A0A2H9THQ6_9FUNG|nr:hypothetical protein PSACC_03043 [Paramicrosporidium saccamoebae]